MAGMLYGDTVSTRFWMLMLSMPWRLVQGGAAATELFQFGRACGVGRPGEVRSVELAARQDGFGGCERAGDSRGCGPIVPRAKRIRLRQWTAAISGDIDQRLLRVHSASPRPAPTRHGWLCRMGMTHRDTVNG